MITINKKWFICFSCTTLMFCTVGLASSAFSVYQPYLIEIIGLSNTEASMFITIRSMCCLLCTFLVQIYINKLGLRLGTALACICTAVAFFILGLSNNFQSCAVSAVLMGLGYGFGGLVPVSIIIHRTFKKHMGLALSICSAGTGLSLIICPPIATKLIELYSLKVSLFLEAMFIAFAAAFIYFTLNSPVISESNHKFKQSTNKTPFKSLHTSPESTLIFIAMVFIGTMGNTGWAHLGVLYSTEGFSPNQVAFLISSVGVFLTIGKIVYGECLDLIGSRKTLVFTSMLLFIGQTLACCANTRNIHIALVSMLCFGFSLPLSTMGPSIFSKDFVPPEQFDDEVRILQLAYMLGALLFGPVPGLIADINGSYIPAFKILTVLCTSASLMIHKTYKRKQST